MPRMSVRSGGVAPRNANLAATPARAIPPPVSELIPAAELPAFQTQLLGWFAEAKRDLDWRRTRDAYRVWISEIMLQQTRVAAVLPYYQRFLARFPTLDALARARLDAVRGDLRRPKRWRELAAAANALLPAQAASAAGPPSSPGDWNQAMMELGATLCTPRGPQCAVCPVARWCRAHALGIALRLPAPRRKPKSVRLALSAAVLLDPRGRTLLLRQKGQHSSLFSRLWHFPAIQSARDRKSTR